MKDRKQLASESPAGPNTAKRGKTSAGLNTEIQGKIGQQLRAYYAGLIEPTPDRFVDLLSQLDKPGGKEPSK